MSARDEEILLLEAGPLIRRLPVGKWVDEQRATRGLAMPQMRIFCADRLKLIRRKRAFLSGRWKIMLIELPVDS